MRHLIAHSMWLGLAATAITPAPGYSQESGPSVEEVIQHFMLANETPDRRRVVNWVPNIMLHPERYSRPFIMKVLDGLEKLAISPDPQQRVSTSAVYWIGELGSQLNPSGSADYGVVARLERIFWAADGLRTAVIWNLSQQRETRAAAKALETMAALDDAGEWPSSSHAARTLLGLGAEGRAALIRLHDSGAARNSSTRALIADIVTQKVGPP